MDELLMSIDYTTAAALLSDVYLSTEKDMLEGSIPTIDADIVPAFDVILQSKTQAQNRLPGNKQQNTSRKDMK